MNGKFKIGDVVICTRNAKYHSHNQYHSSVVYRRDREKGKVLTITKIVNRFGKQFLYFNEYKPKKIICIFMPRYSSAEKVFPLEASRFEFANPFRQEELDI